jgi:hypothetical protein
MGRVNVLKLLDNVAYLLEWVDEAPGWFSVTDVTNDADERLVFTRKFETLVKTGFLERHGKKRGCYRKKESDLVEMDFINANEDPVDIWLPFDISDLVEIYDGNLILIAGAKDSGKTCLNLNVIKENRNRMKVHYFNSEMGAGELKKRLSSFPDIGLDQWNFKAYERAENFEDVVFPGTGNLNIIDFLEIHDEFYVIGKKLKAIHDRLKGAVAIVCLQKNPNQDTGLGGWRSMEVTRLALALDYEKVKITVGKNRRDPAKNPRGLIKYFKIKGGYQIIDRGEWHREIEKEKKDD